MIIAAIVALMYWNNFVGTRTEITYDFFQDQVDANNVAEVDFNQQQVAGRFRKPVAAPKSFDDIISEVHDHGPASNRQNRRAKRVLEFKVTLPLAEIDKSSLIDALMKHRVVIHSQSSDSSGSAVLMYLVLPLLLFGAVWWFTVACGGRARPDSGWRASGGLQQEPRQTLRQQSPSDHVCRRGRPGDRQRGFAGSGRLPQEPRDVSAARGTLTP